MKTVSEVAALTGVSQRTLHYYDEIGLLKPTDVTDAGYRLYGPEAIERLQHILLLRELEFPLKQIRDLLESPDFDRAQALEQHLQLLTLKKQRLEGLIDLTRSLQSRPAADADLARFDASAVDEYAARARSLYAGTDAYREYEQRFLGKSKAARKETGRAFMQQFSRFGAHLGENPASPAVQCLVEELQAFITRHFYTCTDQILASFADLYLTEEFTRNIDAACGEGTARLASDAIRIYTAGVDGSSSL